MSDVGVSPLVQAQDMGTVHDSTCAEVTDRFWGPGIDALNMPS